MAGWEKSVGRTVGTEEYEQRLCERAAERWQRLIEWFIHQKEGLRTFVDTAYVEIGDFRSLPHLAAMQKTFEIRPGALPRQSVGVTAAGGLAGGFWMARDYCRFR